MVVQGLIVTILLGPKAIGLYGIVTTTAVTVAALRRVGIDEAFVQQREPDQEAEFQRAFTLELLVGAAFSLVLLARLRSSRVAYGDGRLLALMAAVAYLPTAFALQAPTWIFFRRMDFVRVRIAAVDRPGGDLLRHRAAGRGRRRRVEPRDRPRGRQHGRPSSPAMRGLALPAAAALRPRRARARYFRFSWPVFVSRGGAAARPAGPDARVHAARRPGRGRLHHAGRDADPLRRPRRPDHRHHDLSGDLRGPRPDRHSRRCSSSSNRRGADVGAPVLRRLHPVLARSRPLRARRQVAAGRAPAPGARRRGRDPAARLQLVLVLPRARRLGAPGGGVRGDDRRLPRRWRSPVCSSGECGASSPDGSPPR